MTIFKEDKVMKKRVVSLALALSMVAGLTACGGNSNGGNAGSQTGYVAEGEEGKIINIYCWNDEFRTRVEAVYDKVDHTSPSCLSFHGIGSNHPAWFRQSRRPPISRI